MSIGFSASMVTELASVIASSPIDCMPAGRTSGCRSSILALLLMLVTVDGMFIILVP